MSTYQKRFGAVGRDAEICHFFSKGRFFEEGVVERGEAFGWRFGRAGQVLDW